jgi:hypothetical protein
MVITIKYSKIDVFCEKNYYVYTPSYNLKQSSEFRQELGFEQELDQHQKNIFDLPPILFSPNERIKQHIECDKYKPTPLYSSSFVENTPSYAICAMQCIETVHSFFMQNTETRQKDSSIHLIPHHHHFRSAFHSNVPKHQE